MNSKPAGETKVSPAFTTIQGHETATYQLSGASIVNSSAFLRFAVMGLVEYDTVSQPDHRVITQAFCPQDESSSAHVTQLLNDWQRGSKLALDELMPLVYRELRHVAAGYLRNERANHTLQPTALIHESYVRLVGQDMPEWKNREHFFGVASRLMRQILVDYARNRKASKRAGDQVRVPFEEAQTEAFCIDSERILALDAALNKLAEFDERKTRIVEMRLFGGMPLADIATALEVSEPTIKRDLRIVKAWLRVEIGK